MTVIPFPDRLGEISPQGLDGLPVFIDWVSCHQDHDLGCRVINDGHTFKVDADDQLIFETGTRLRVVGSFDSSIQIRSDGKRVSFTGNIARFNRKDNLFGFGLGDTFRRINALLNLFDLPPFSFGVRHRFADAGIKYVGGCVVTRLDLTCNYVTGSPEKAIALLRVLAGQHVGRQKGSLYPDGQTVVYGSGSSYVYSKCYIKAQEMIKHRKKKDGRHVDQEVIDFANDLGIVREEIELKRDFLAQNDLLYLAQLNHDLLMDIYLNRTQMRRFDQVKYEDTTDLPRHLKATYHSWRNCESCGISRATWFRHRSELLKYGVDISVPSNVHTLPVRVKTVEVAALTAPDWYKRKYG